MDFAPTAVSRKAKSTSTLTSASAKAEERYWRDFKSSVFIKSYAPIVSLHFSQSSPYRYAVTSGTRLQIYNSKTNRVVKTISKFKELARSGTIRDDGNLVIAADDSGLVQIFDIKSRAVLRSIRAHKQPVHVTLFSPTTSSHGKPTFLTASDDTTLKLYDLGTSEQISYLTGHADYVRTAAYVPSNPHLIVSGSYDGTIKVWDTRPGGSRGENEGEDATDEPAPRLSRRERGMAKEIMSLDHGHPVEKVLVHPNGTQVISAGGPVIKVWDILTPGGKCLRAMSNHQKTVTCLEWGDGRPFSTTSGTGSSGKKRLLSAGLDGLIKSYDIEDNYRVGKTMRVGAGVLSLAMAPDEGTLLIGTSTGELTVRRRIIAPGEKEKRSKNASGLGGVDALGAGPGEYEAILAAQSLNQAAADRSDALMEGLPSSEQLLQQQQRATLTQVQRIDPKTGEVRIQPLAARHRLKEWDKLLKNFRYSDVLDSVTSKGVNTAIAFSVISELMHRDGLHQALNARDEVSLLPILRFLYEHVADPRYSALVCDTLSVLIDLYTPALGQSPQVDNMFTRLKQKVQQEIDFQRTVMQVKGQLQMILATQG